MITSVYFDNFKAHRRYSIALNKFNILVGPNNSGKSSALDAFRILAGAYRYAARYNPTWHMLPGVGNVFGYKIPESSIPITIENVHTDYNEQAASLRFRFSEGQSLKLTFYSENSVFLTFDTPRRAPATASAFRREFPLSLAVVPMLGPLEHDEDIAQEDYVSRWRGSHRSPRLFRNTWYYDNGGFEQFKKIVEETWPGMSVELPTKADPLSSKLVMFYKESRIDREIFWAGHGFQIWLQLLTQLIKARDADLIVVDEPEIYLHPDLQRKIVTLLKRIGPAVVMATHSVEIINEVDPEEILLIDKSQRAAKRIADIAGLEEVNYLLGSTQNIHLARLTREKRILFVEGKDKRLLDSFSGFYDMSEALGKLTVIPIGGFTQHSRILNAKWTFKEILDEDVELSALFDRDYRCDDEIKDFKGDMAKEVPNNHVLKRKEIENYLLIPSAIEKAVLSKLHERLERGALKEIPAINVEEILLALTDGLKAEVLGQLGANAVRYNSKKGIDPSTTLKTVNEKFEKKWTALIYRLETVSGKELLSLLNEYLQKTYGISITHRTILNNSGRADFDDDLKVFFDMLRVFIQSPRRTGQISSLAKGQTPIERDATGAQCFY